MGAKHNYVMLITGDKEKYLTEINISTAKKGVVL